MIDFANIHLKSAKKGDLKIIEKIENRLKSKTFKPFGEEGDVKQYFQKNNIFLILKGNKPIGTVSYKIKSGKNIKIDGLAVLPNYQRKGIGSNVAKKIIKIIGKKKIYLVAHPNNKPVLIIYLKLGFIIKDFRKNYFGDGEPRLVLWKI